MHVIIAITQFGGDYDFTNTPSAYGCHPSYKDGNWAMVIWYSPLCKRGAELVRRGVEIEEVRNLTYCS